MKLALHYQSRGSRLNNTRFIPCLTQPFILRGRLNEYQELLMTWWIKVYYHFAVALQPRRCNISEKRNHKVFLNATWKRQSKMSSHPRIKNIMKNCKILESRTLANMARFKITEPFQNHESYDLYYKWSAWYFCIIRS